MLMICKVEELRKASVSGRRQAYASNIGSVDGQEIRENISSDSAYSASSEDRVGTRVAEMESEIKALRVS